MNRWVTSLRYAALGMELVFTTLFFVGGGLWLGRWADRHWNRSPLFLLVGLLLGLGLSLWGWVEQLRWILRDSDRPSS